MATKYSVEDLLNQCRKLYKKNGISVFLYKNFDKTLYFRLYQHGLKQHDVLEHLGLLSEFSEYKIKNARWTWHKIITEIRPIVKQQNFLPPAGWFQANGYASIVHAVYAMGKNWDDLRKEFSSYENSSFVISRNGIRWRSHPEASMSNFLYSRGICHKVGQKYPDEYSSATGLSYGYYDLQFVASNGQTIKVEIWGEKPNGHNAKHYEYKKNLKIQFHSSDNCFLGIDFQDCYNEDKLEKILEPYIGIIKPFIFRKFYDKVIPSTHWSNADELIEYCRQFAQQMPDGRFPTEEWLRKRGKWKCRDGEAYNTLSIYIKKWIGGIRRLRDILGQPENSTIQWDKDKVIAEYRNIYQRYGLTTGQLRGKIRRNEISISESDRFFINNLDAAIQKHFDSVYDLNELTGIKNTRRRIGRKRSG